MLTITITTLLGDIEIQHFKQTATKAWPNEINLLQNKLREHYKNEL